MKEQARAILALSIMIVCLGALLFISLSKAKELKDTKQELRNKELYSPMQINRQMKVGDKVRISKDSMYYDSGTKENPSTIGTVAVIGIELVTVDWTDKVTNYYQKNDLEVLVKAETTHRETAKIVMYLLNKLNELEFETKNDD